VCILIKRIGVLQCNQLIMVLVFKLGFHFWLSLWLSIQYSANTVLHSIGLLGVLCDWELLLIQIIVNIKVLEEKLMIFNSVIDMLLIVERRLKPAVSMDSFEMYCLVDELVCRALSAALPDWEARVKFD